MTESSTSLIDALATAPVAHALVGADDRVLEANAALSDLLGGFDPVGAPLTELVSDASRPGRITGLLAEAREGRTARDELQVAQVGERWLSILAWRSDHHDDAVHVLVVDRPRRSTRAERFDLLDHSPGASVIVGADLAATASNDAWRAMTRLDARRSDPMGWLEAVDREARAAFMVSLRAAFVDGMPVGGRLRLFVDGTPCWTEVRAVPFVDDPPALLVSFVPIGDALEEARRAHELTRVLEASPDLVAVLDASGREITWSNEALATHLRRLGIDDESGARILPLLDQWSQAHYAASALAEVLRSGTWTGELGLAPHGDEPVRPISAVLVSHRSPDGDVEAISMVARDLRALREAERKIQASEVRLAALVEHASDLVCVVSAAGRVIYASPAVGRILGHEALDGRHIVRLVHADDRQRAIDMARTILAEPGMSDPYTFRVAHADGGWRHVEVVATNLCTNPAINGIVVNGRDITERVDAAAKLERRANHDDLTGLANRSLLTERLAVALRRAADRRRVVGVLFVDLDRFKVVNDSLGHAVGDELIVEVAARIDDVVRPGDTVARLGGDEFVIVLDGMARRSDASVAAERVRAAIARPVTIGGETTVVTASVGIAVAGPTSTVEELLRDADTALYRAKDTGRDRSDVFDDHLRDTAIRRHSVEQQLRRAIDDGKLETWFQPVVSIETGRVTGAEALVRLRDESGELLVPTEFIEIAEDSGLITRAGAQVLEAACAQAVTWAELRPDAPPSVAVNVSARQLADADFAGFVAATLTDTGLPPHRLSLELTESALIDANPITEQILREIDELGVHLGLDDFGTGFSSLAYLKRFPIDFVKIDRSFTRGLGTDDNDTAIVRATIALAHSLGLRVVAEGIEHDGHLDQLRALACDLGQGYLFGHPMEPEPFARHLTA